MSVRLSPSCISSKRVYISSKLFHHRQPHHSSFFCTNRYDNIPTGTPLNRGKSRDFVSCFWIDDWNIGSSTFRPLSEVIAASGGLRLSWQSVTTKRHTSVNLVYDSKPRRRLYQSTGTSKRTEQNLIVRIGKSEAELTIIKDCTRGIVLLKLTTNRHKASRGLSATEELLVVRYHCGLSPLTLCHQNHFFHNNNKRSK